MFTIKDSVISHLQKVSKAVSDLIFATSLRKRSGKAKY